MNENTRDTKEDIDLPSDAYRLGVDCDGREHWHSPMRSHVWVNRDGDLVHQQQLESRSVVQWVLFVDEKAGWDERQPVEESGGLGGIVEEIATQLEVA